MLRSMMLLSFLLMYLQPVAPKKADAPAAVAGPTYTADGEMVFPADYPEWVFLTSGLDMSYVADAGPATRSTFNNIFVNPAAYRVYMKTGTWPDGTMIMLEHRGAEGNHSINTRGKTQAVEVTGNELHVKDSKRGGWAFYNFGGKKSAKVIARPASCYTCHEAHAAVDTTFVQFYPTLMGVAKEKGVLSAEYLKDEAAAKEAVPVVVK